MSTLAELSAKLDRTNALLLDLLTTARFTRGGYDGPIQEARTLGLQHSNGTVELFGGRGDPTAILIEFGDISHVVGTATLYVGTDAGSVRGGFRLVVAAGAQLRIICDAHQRLYGWMDYTTAAIPIKVIESRL